MSEIMIFKEKHAERYFVVNSKEDQHKVALKILRERYNEGYWYPTVEYIEKDRESAVERLNKKYDQNIITLTEDEVEGLPESLQVAARQEREKYNKSLFNVDKYINSEILWVKDLERLVKADPEDAIKMTFTNSRGRSMNLAMYLLDSRSGAEYEEYTVESSEEY